MGCRNGVQIDDPQKCKIFVQSHITGHTELAWVLGCMTPLGQLQRMTQFKDKSKGGGKAIGAGLLYYPVLMAADILLYNVDRVPVGQDQKQHLELTRDLAVKFNHTYGPIFTVPEPYIPDTAARIMSLQDPEAKMSKSDPNPRGVLSLLDPPKTMRKKIMSAVTDTGCEIVAREDKPGMSNLLQLFSALTERSISELEQAFVGQGYGVFKGELADAVIAAIEPIQERYQTLMQDPAYLYSVLEEGRVAAQERASAMLDAVYERIGFARAGGNTQ